MKNKHSIFLVLMIFSLIAALSACAKKNVPPPPGYGGAPGGQEYGPGAGGGTGGMDDARLRELGHQLGGGKKRVSGQG